MSGRVAPRLLAAGVVLGTGWRVLQLYVPDRLNLALGFGVLLLVLALLYRRGLLHLQETEATLLGVPAMLLLVALIWRDSGILFAANLLALAGLVALARPVRVGLRAHLFEGGLGDLLRRLHHAATRTAVGPWRLAVACKSTRSVNISRSPWAAGLGVLAISPVLVLFGVLLAGADPVFESLLRRLIDPERLLQQLVPLAFFSWLGAGILWALTRAPSARDMEHTGGRVHSSIITGALAPIALLFAAFLLVQSRYLFGGRAFVLGTADLTFSTYARRGFFELVTVSAMMLPILLLADWAANQYADRDRRRFQVLAHTLLVLLAGLLASALFRMLTYTREFGLTEQRLFTTVFMAWLACVFAWFSASVLRGRRDRFLAGALGATLVTLVALNVVGPDSVIVRVNTMRAGQGHALDASYIARLSAGAVPAALRVLPDLSADARCDLTQRLARRWRATEKAPRKTWNIERWRATGPLLADLEHEADAACGRKG